MRETTGTKVQAVLNNIDADTEGIISTLNQGYISAQYEITVPIFVARVTGMSAGCAINKSLTYYAFEDATEIINQLTHEQIIDALRRVNLFFLLAKMALLLLNRILIHCIRLLH